MRPQLFSVYRRSSLPIFLGSVIALEAILAANSVHDVHVNRNDDVTLTVYFVALTIGLLGTGFSLCASHVPAWRIHLLHRGVPSTRLFDANLLATLVPGLSVMIAGILIPTGFLKAFGRDGTLITARSTFELLAIGSSVLSGMGLGAWFSSLRGTVGSIATRAILGLSAVVTVGLYLMTPWRDTFAAPVAPYLAFQSSVFAIGVVAARRNHLSANDPDRPTSSSRLLTIAASNSLACAICLLLVLPLAQHEIAKSHMRYPNIAQIEATDTTAILAPIGGGKCQVVDANHSPAGPIFDYSELGSTHFQWSHGDHERLGDAHAALAMLDRGSGPDFRFGSSWSGIVFSAFSRAYLIRETGELIVVNRARPSRSAESWKPASRFVVARPDGRSFSPRADVLGVISGLGATSISGDGAAILGDPEDGTLHRLDLDDIESPRLVPIVFRDGDRFRGWQELASRRTPTDGKTRIELNGNLESYAVLGEKGRYTIGHDFALSPADDLALGYWRSATNDRRVSIVQTGDALRFTVIVSDDDGKEFIRHEYEPRTLREKTVGALLGGLAAMRPLPLLTVGFLTEPSRGKLYVADSFFDPRVRRGAGAMWLSTALACAVLLAFGAKRRLERMGADPERWRVWAGCFLVFGPAAWLAYRLIETDRAHAREPTVEGAGTQSTLVVSA